MNNFDDDYCLKCNEPILFPEKPCPKCGYKMISRRHSSLQMNFDFIKFFMPITLVFIVIYVILSFWVPQTPEYSIYMTISSLKNKDADTFKEYVDLDNVTNSFFDEFMKDGMSNSNNAMETVATTLAYGFVNMIKPQIKDYIRLQVENFIENPEKYNFNTNEIDLTNLTGFLIFKRFNGLQLSINRQNANTYKVDFINNLNNSTINLKLKKDNYKNRYVIVSIFSEDFIKQLKNNKN